MRDLVTGYRGRHAKARGSARNLGMLFALLMLVAGILSVADTADASPVSAVSMTGSTYSATASATWTTTFTTSGNGALANGNTITVTLASGFVVPATFTPTVTWGGSNTCGGSTGSGTQAVGTVHLGCAIPKTSRIDVVIPGITNATAGSYANGLFSVKTQSDTQAVSPANQASGYILYGTASKLAFGATLSNATAGVAFSPQPSIIVQDSGGRTVADSSASITLAVTGGGAALTCTGGLTAAASGGSAQFSGCSMTIVGTYTLTATATSLTSAVSNSFVVSAATAKQLAFTQAPSSAFAGAAISPAVRVQLQDQFGNSVASSGVSISLSASTGSMTVTSPATTDASGVASFSNVTYAATVLGTKLIASSSGLTSATSPSFDVTVNVTSSANALSVNAADAGSGVKSVSYYYCSGLSGTCTNGSPIGTSNSSANNYLVNWTSRPVAGSYRVVAVATDNVGNTSAVSGSTPVTVSS